MNPQAFGPLSPANTKPPLTRSYWVLPNLLLAGCYPGGKDEAAMRARLADLIRVGVRVFLNLTQRGESGTFRYQSAENGGKLPLYADLARDEATKQGVEVRCVRLSIPDLGITSVEAMREALAVMELAISEGRCVYVHCLGGVGRTGTMVSAFLLRNGYATAADVWKLMDRLRQQDTEKRWSAAPATLEQCNRALEAGLGDVPPLSAFPFYTPPPKLPRTITDMPFVTDLETLGDAPFGGYYGGEWGPVVKHAAGVRHQPKHGGKKHPKGKKGQPQWKKPAAS